MKTHLLALTGLALTLFPATAPAQFGTSGTSSSTAVAPKLPPLKIQTKVGTKRNQQANSFYMQTMTISPQVVVEGAATQPLPALEATMIIITMDTEAKYRQRREKYDVHTNETITLPAVERGTRRDFEFKTSQVAFDAWRDKTNVGGAVYKYFIFGLRDPASKELVFFETNQPDLDKLVRSKPEKRDEYLKLVKGASFPTDVK
jgi:hypothetical protein